MKTEVIEIVIPAGKMACPKCSGRKHLEVFSHVANGICFQCNGSGTVEYKEYKNQISPENQYKAEYILASTPETWKGLSYARLFKARNFAHGGWGLSQAYPGMLAHWREVGEPEFLRAQERKLEAYYRENPVL